VPALLRAGLLVFEVAAGRPASIIIFVSFMTAVMPPCPVSASAMIGRNKSTTGVLLRCSSVMRMRTSRCLRSWNCCALKSCSTLSGTVLDG